MAGLSLITAAFLAAAPVGAEPPAPSAAEQKAALDRIQAVFLDLQDATPPRPEEAALGRQLFFDPRLSRERTLSCASCHQPSLAWTDGLPKARGAGHKELRRNTPTLLDVARRAPFFRDGRAATLEAQALVPLTEPDEMGLTLPELEARLSAVPAYARLFQSVYGGKPTPARAARALAAFERGIASGRDADFDRFRRGEAPLSAEQARGLVLFAGKARCVLCHVGPDFSDGFFHALGRARESGEVDPGRYAVVPIDYAYRAFKTPSLRDAAWTPPYFHDGAMPDLRAVVDFYDRGGDGGEEKDGLIRPLGLTEREKRDLVAFLGALSGAPPRVSAPVLPPDEEGPSMPDAGGALSASLQAAAEKGDAAALREAGVKLEALARSRRLALTAAGTPVPDCLNDVEDRARRFGYGPSQPAGEAARAASLSQAWSRCAALQGWLGAPPAADGLAGADAALARGERLFAAAPAPAEREACRAAFDPDELIADLKEGRLEPQAADALTKSTFEDLLRWRAWRAAGSSSDAACDSLKGLDRIYNGLRGDAASACREASTSLRFSRALMRRSQDWPRACRASLAYDYAAMGPGAAERVCGAVERLVDDPPKLCASLVPEFLTEERLPSCVAEFARYAKDGDGGDCGSIAAGADVLKGRCEALKAFRRAVSAGPGACGGSELCRVLAGDAAPALAKLKARMGTAACALSARGRNSQRHGDLALAGREAESARLALAAVEASRAMSDRSTAARIDALAARAARLEASVSAAIQALPTEEGEPPMASDGSAPR